MEQKGWTVEACERALQAEHPPLPPPVVLVPRADHWVYACKSRGLSVNVYALGQRAGTLLAQGADAIWWDAYFTHARSMGARVKA